MSTIRALTVLTVLCASCAAIGQPNSDLDVYAKPGVLVDIGHARYINLRCSGKGDPTVILESGAVADSFDWFKVQPQVAKFSRVCSYDRAGYGFSDGGASKNYIIGSVNDLHVLIYAAHIAKPVVLVGHSLGSDIVRDYASRFSNDVAALVLLDPPPQDLQGVTDEQRQERDEGIAGRTAMLEACKKGAAKLQGDSPPEELKSCLRPPNPDYSAQLNAARRVSKSKLAFWDSVTYALDAGNAMDTQPVSVAKVETRPLLILQPDTSFEDAPPKDKAMLEAARQRTQRLIAATSTRAEIIPVAHSTHDVQFDRPDAVVEAIRKARAESSPR